MFYHSIFSNQTISDDVSREKSNKKRLNLKFDNTILMLEMLTDFSSVAY